MKVSESANIRNERLRVVIMNYNRTQLTVSCVASVQQQKYDSIGVVDNHSEQEQYKLYCALTFLLCFWFIPRYSLLGAGIATIASAFLQLFLVGMVLSLDWGAKMYRKQWCSTSICKTLI